ncbi:V-set domain-containing T-cell activation inhibitor 1-like [Sparus aurata]|uniref:V-set domain-containing T-cell activation inhibitor 1-like n=1 Tax=Sparus aurata TaxID=8175 RepID=UPI0011C17959|nr:V-set domain-containing T-cell activation inhibitor 1-like [Sparus aurata]
MHVFIWFGFWLFSLYSLPVTTGQSNLICSTQPIVAHAGDDVILSCRLDPPISASSRTVEWTKPGLDPEYIHVHQDGRLVYQSQNPLYNYRTALFVDQLINGNVSMKIFRVKTSDAGKYKCFLPSLWKETFIELKIEDDFMDPSSCTPCVAMFILAVVLLVWKWRQSKTETKKKNEEKELKKMEDLDKILTKLSEELLNKDEEQKDMTKIIERLKEVSEKLVKQKEQLIVQMQKAEKQNEENEKKVKSVDKEVTEKEGDKTLNRAQGYLKLKEIIQEANWNLEERKKEHQQLLMTTVNLTKRTVDEVKRISEKKEQVERHMQQIKKQIEEIQRKLQLDTIKLVN